MHTFAVSFFSRPSCRPPGVGLALEAAAVARSGFQVCSWRIALQVERGAGAFFE